MREYLDSRQVFEMTGTPVETLRYWRWRRKGEGPKSFKLGRRVLYDRRDVEAWIEAARAARQEHQRAG